MQEDHSGQNLSEVLFKPKFKFTETSLISNSGIPLPKLSRKDRSLGFRQGWYRSVNRFLWTWLGGNLLDLDEVLARIAFSRSKRSRPECLDTVSDYCPGNWIYEFSAMAQKRYLRAEELHARGAERLASHNYRMATRYFAIASYPSLRGDSLAGEAALLCRKNYRLMFECDPDNGVMQEPVISSKYGRFSGFLHLPSDNGSYPCVIILGSYEQNISDFYRFYNDYLRPDGIAALMLNLPGLATSEKILLSPDYSVILDAAVQYLKGVLQINSTRLGLMGVRMGGTACIRECTLHPGVFRAIMLFNPAVNSLFTDQHLLNSMPLCMRSLYANRLNLNASDWDTIIPQMQVLSLKKQGLLSSSGVCTTPCLCCAIRDSLTSAEDIKLLKLHFKDFKLESRDNPEAAPFLLHTYQCCRDFFKEKL